jgi:hypothetical protein
VRLFPSLTTHLNVASIMTAYIFLLLQSQGAFEKAANQFPFFLFPISG